MKLEVVVIPVSDVDRAKRFYGGLGWRLDADFVVGDTFRGVQFTPPGSPCSIHFGKGITSAAPGSASGMYLVVSDIEAARAELVGRGVDVSEVFHRAGPGKPAVSGRDPERRSYSSFATFGQPTTASRPAMANATTSAMAMTMRCCREGGRRAQYAMRSNRHAKRPWLGSKRLRGACARAVGGSGAQSKL